MKHSTKISKIQSGQARAQAKGAKRKAVVVKGLGVAICSALEQQDTTVRTAILAVIGTNDETILQTMLEVEARRDTRIGEVKGERKDKRIASIRVMFSRINVILRAIKDKLNLDKIKGAASFAEMYAYASNKSKNPGKRSSKPLTETQFKDWSGKLQRIVGEFPGKNAKAAEVGTFQKQLAHLEDHVRNCIGVLSKFSTLTVLPVRDMLGLIARRKQHVKLVRKAA